MVLPSRMKRCIAVACVAAGMAPTAAFACACGCSIFDVGTSTLLPAGAGGTVFAEYDFLDQTRNWSGNSRAPAADNADKRIRSNFYLLGGQYMFNDDWGAMVEVPYTDRHFRTTDPDNSGTFRHAALGDIRVMGVYSGFAPDMSTGIVFGLKLPTGDHTYPHFDPDVEIGSGSTDVLLGAYHTGALVADQSWIYFLQVLWQHEVATQDSYRPGYELNGAAGISYTDWKMGKVGIAPTLQLLVSNRGRDGGAGDPGNTGYTRLFVSPGVAFQLEAWKLYADVEVPVYQHVNGNQLMAPEALKLIASYSF